MRGSAVSKNHNCITNWLQVNVPVYMSQARAAGAPVVTRAGEYLGRLEEATRENRQQALNKVYGLAPEMWDQLGIYIHLCWDFILDYTYWVQGHIANLYIYVYHWVDTNVLQGDFSSKNIQENVSWSASKVQNLTLSAFQWCQQWWVKT
ncbi:uncharacterized protein LOC128214659 [Mya arenaria]|uniref:uncharacterized protein LOC128214659 n=1 Tax=Mya arenaria TaxID=6604 RepID=UPI0022E89137|nr:uncharacterized protein LOC128214659 [Mya arenaria]